tara:strand:+ start:278 stop:472 length:195 start_codon:yes stop_codon:yes gene_type:complete
MQAEDRNININSILNLKNYKYFPFEERKQYEETFVENNSALKERFLGTPIETKRFRLYPQYTSI